MRVGVIGLGAIAPLHINSIKESGQTVVALCDTKKERLRAFNQEFALNANEYDDYREMISKENLDVVHVCTPHYLHAEMVCYALGKDVNVFCEKPLAISFAQLDEIERAVKASRAQLGVCFQNRYNASIRYIKDFFKEGEVVAAMANLTWQRDAAYYATGAWRGTKAQEGGGVMINQSIHTLDILQWICGMPTAVTARLSNDSLQGVIEVEDTAFGLFELPNGGNFIINATNASKHSFPIFASYHGEKDTVEISGDNLIVNGKFVTRSDGLPLFGKEEWGVGHLHAIADYYVHVKEGKQFPIDFYEGAKAVRLILRMYESNGKKIEI